MANEKDKLNKVNTPEVPNDGFTKDDFKFVQADKTIHEQKFQTKPTTFFKDSLKRFSKNKSSVVAAVILGVLLVLSIFIPIAGKVDATHDTSISHPELYYLEPKLFNAGTGFWDGTKKVKNIPVDTSTDPDGLDKENNWWPDPATYDKGAILSKEFTDEAYTDNATKYGKGGYVQFGYYSNIADDKEYVYIDTPKLDSLDLTVNHYLRVFDVLDKAQFEATSDKEQGYPANFEEAKTAFYVSFNKDSSTYSYELVEYATKHDLGVGGVPGINLTEKIVAALAEDEIYDTEIKDVRFEIRAKNQLDKKNNCALIRSVVLDTDSSDTAFKKLFTSPSFKDGNEVMIRETTDAGYWTSHTPGMMRMYLAKAIMCTFTYDTYEAMLGHKYFESFPVTKIKEYKKNGWVTWDDYFGFTYIDENGDNRIVDNMLNFKILDEENCPLAEPLTEKDIILDYFGEFEQISCSVMKYKYDFGLKSMPKFLLGTDKTGRDMLVYVFEGLRWSLILGIATTVICFIFGLFWGSVSGYFGGTVDLAMERFTDILSGIPWIVVMTLVIINMGSNFGTFALALCLTGWIGTAATTRTQFYRFRGREYVLASRTLGASNGRLIVKHILPNAMGTIITSAVLMVPSVIFSEATISFLGLGFKNMSSLGVILSNNQPELTNHPFLLIFPSIIIALLMISFNLFGNGLRDAVNPSLKGEGE